jgi:hypothetical protein
MKERYLLANVKADLKNKMVFIGGPRQVGKTTMSKVVGKNYFKKSAYLNWDNYDDRKMIEKNDLPADSDLIIFDEIHKYRRWKNYVKGVFDKNKENSKIIVTGSARLDLYRRGGDSLLGRYHYYRLHPFSLAELAERKFTVKVLNKINFPELKPVDVKNFSDLLTFGGFPEVFLKKNKNDLRRWHNQRKELLVKQDIRDVETIRDLSGLQILVDILPEKVGSLLSINNLRSDLEINHKTAALWVDVLENFYYHFRIYPFTFSKIKSLRKAAKLYLWDWSQVEDPGSRLENMTASHLLKFVHFLHDAKGYQAELFFWRDLEGREVDFIVAIDKKPWLAIEVKSSQKEVSKNLLYLGAKINIPFKFQLVSDKNIDIMSKGVRVISVDKFLGGLV